MVNNLIARDIEAVAREIAEPSKFLEGKSVLVAGGAGFLGSCITAVFQHLNREVLKNPCRVVVFDNYITGSRKNVLTDITEKNISFEEKDVRVPLKVKGDVDFILHAAGIASPIHYRSHPIEAIESAIWGAKNLLELAKEKKSQGLLFFSSSEIYGDPQPGFIPTPETYHGNVSCIGPRSCYDESKRLGETMCMTYHQRFGIPINIVRPFNVYGPGMRPDDYRVIPNFLACGLTKKPLPVHVGGEQTRTFCYWTDAVTGFLKVLLSQRSGEVYNVGNDQEEIRVKDLATVISGLFNPPAAIQHIEYPTSYPKDEPQRRVPDLTKIRTTLGYRPQVRLEDGLRKTLQWFSHKLAVPAP